MKFEMMNNYNQTAIIRVIGVGSAACDFIKKEANGIDSGVECVLVDTNPKALQNTDSLLTLQLDQSSWDAIQSGDPRLQASPNERMRIYSLLQDADMAIIVVSPTDKYGSMIAPVIADIAKTIGILTIVITEKPDAPEYSTCLRQAECCLEWLHQASDSVIVIAPEQQYVGMDKITDQAGYWPQRLHEIMLRTIHACTDIIIQPGLTRIDFSDVRTILADSGWTVVGLGSGQGVTRAFKAAEQAINCLPLKYLELARSFGVLTLIAGDETLSMENFSEVGGIVREVMSDEVDIVIGTAIVLGTSMLKGELRVTIIVAGVQNV